MTGLRRARAARSEDTFPSLAESFHSSSEQAELPAKEPSVTAGSRGGSPFALGAEAKPLPSEGTPPPLDFCVKMDNDSNSYLTNQYRSASHVSPFY